MDSQTPRGAQDYDEARAAFGGELVARAEYRSVQAVARGYGRFGASGDGIATRIAHGAARGLPPVTRARIWAGLADRSAALALLADWAGELARAGLLDVLSIGDAALGSANGANSPPAPEEYSAVVRASKPMLLQRAAGAEEAEWDARPLEEYLDTAWHESSLWWFSAIDRKGRLEAREALRRRVAALEIIAGDEKPFEPDVVRHVAAMGGDDLSCVLSGLVAAKAAKAAGVRRLILHASLDSSSRARGLDELAKARALLHLVRELEDGDFKVYLETSVDSGALVDDQESNAGFAAAVAMMDDIDAGDSGSPEIVCVAGFPAAAPAEPELVNDRVRLARAALIDYRALREARRVENMASNPRVLARASELLRDTRYAIDAIESSIVMPFGAEGLYEIMAAGFLALPLLPERREEFADAVKWPTARVGGAVVAVDESGTVVSARGRIDAAALKARSRSAP